MVQKRFLCMVNFLNFLNFQFKSERHQNFIFNECSQLIFRFPTILNELIRKSDQDLKVCTIIGNMDVTTAKTVNSCTELLDYFMFEVLIMIGAVFTVVFIIFAYTIDIVGKSNLLSKLTVNISHILRPCL